MQRQQALAEQKRLEQEREERERKRAMNEIQQIKDRHLKEKIQQISSTQGQKFLQKIIKDVRCFCCNPIVLKKITVVNCWSFVIVVFLCFRMFQA